MRSALHVRPAAIISTDGSRLLTNERLSFVDCGSRERLPLLACPFSTVRVALRERRLDRNHLVGEVLDLHRLALARGLQVRQRWE